MTLAFNCSRRGADGGWMPANPLRRAARSPTHRKEIGNDIEIV
jgi:hypothetical protein